MGECASAYTLSIVFVYFNGTDAAEVCIVLDGRNVPCCSDVLPFLWVAFLHGCALFQGDHRTACARPRGSIRGADAVRGVPQPRAVPGAEEYQTLPRATHHVRHARGGHMKHQNIFGPK